MADFIDIGLPPGWTGYTASPTFNNTRIGKPGQWTLVPNTDFAVWTFEVSYFRGSRGSDEEKRFGAVERFFLTTKAANAFYIDDIFDNTHDAMDGSGVVELVNGVYRLMKRYPSGGGYYDHPITRPKSPVVLAGGASGGTVNYGTGIVTGISAAGTWTGGFKRPCIFAENGIKYSYDLAGRATLTVTLEEQIEV